MKTLGLLGAVLAAITTAYAQPITYVDATHGASGNTTLTDGSEWNPLASQSFTSNDGVWEFRAFGNNSSIYQNTAFGTVDNAHRLKTTVTGLALDTYNVYAYFWSDVSSWRMGASLTDDAGELPMYQFNPLSPGTVQHWSGADGTVFSSSLGPNPFTTAVMISEGNRRLIQINLGQVTGTGFSVFIDDFNGMVDANQRTWYDGVGYSVVPEPSSAALLGLGSLGAILLRRRQS
jgi:hypothetical protein